MTVWLAAASLTAAIVMSGRPPPAARIASWLPEPARPAAGAGPVIWIAAAVVGSALIAAKVAPALVVAVMLAAVVAPRIAAGRRAATTRKACRTATAEVTFALAGELRAGRTPAQALAAVARSAGPLTPALDAAQAAVAMGASAATELALAAATPGAERLRYVAAAWAVAEGAGGKIAVVLERLSEAMDSDDELRDELAAAMAGPRATMVMLAALPVLGLALGQAVGAQPLRLLVHRPVGWALLVAAAVLDAMGVWATRAIARAALRP
jgi:tight adherence protein B